MKNNAKKHTLFCERITEIYIYFIFVVLSLFCFPDYSHITASKFNLFFIGTAIYVLLLFEALITAENSQILFRLKQWRSPPALALLTFLVFSIISFALSPHINLSLLGSGKFDGVISSILYFIAFFGVLSFGEFKARYITAFLPVVLFNFVLSLLQFFSLNPFWLYPQNMNYHDAFRLYANEFMGSFGNVDIFSAFMAMAVPLFGIATLKYHGKIRILSLISLFASSFMLFLCGVYAGIVGASFGILAIAFSIYDNCEYKFFMLSLSVISFAVCNALILKDHIWALLLFLLALFFVILSRIKSFNRKIFLISFYSFSTIAVLIFACCLIAFGLDSGRLRIWKDAFRIFLDHPLLGSGPGTFINEVSFSFTRQSEYGIIESAIDCAHNIYLNILSCGGILSFTAFMAFAILVLKKSKNSLLFPAIIAYLALGFFSFEVCSISAIFYVICGLAVDDRSNNFYKDV